MVKSWKFWQHSKKETAEKDEKKISSLDNELNKEENKEIKDIQSMKRIFKEIQDTLENNEQNVLTILANAKKEVYDEKLIASTGKNFTNAVNRIHSFIGAVAQLVNTCNEAIKIDNDIKSKIMSSELFNYDVENKEIELKELKVLTEDELKILNDAKDLESYMSTIIGFLKSFTLLDVSEEDQKEIREEFKESIKHWESTYNKINTNILRCDAKLTDISAILNNLLIVMAEADRRFKISFAAASKRIREGAPAYVGGE